jgi:hypothetical protein
MTIDHKPLAHRAIRLSLSAIIAIAICSLTVVALVKADPASGTTGVGQMHVVVQPGIVQTSGYTVPSLYPEPSEWRAKWIGIDPIDPATKAILFRKEFTLASRPASVQAWISADSCYRLYINGQLVSRGPADIGRDFDRCKQGTSWLYDSRDLSMYFNAGTNVIAAEVFIKPIASSQATRGKCGFLFQAEAKSTEQTRLLCTDSTWSVAPDLAWGDLSYDERKEYPGWLTPGFDVSSWKFCVVLGDSVKSPWTPLEVSELPPMMEVRYPELSIRDASPNVSVRSKENKSIQLTGDGDFVVQFDRVLAGYPTLSVNGIAGAQLEIIPIERHNESWRKIKLTLRDGPQTFQYAMLDSFSRLHIKATHVKSPVDITDIGAVFSGYPVEYKGSFECNDPALNRLWLSSRWLTQICMQTHHLDSPNHQEPICDPGDYLIESVENYYAFGEAGLARQDLRKFGRMLAELHYQNFHTSYSLLWLQMLMQYYQFTGDADLLKELSPQVYGLLDTFTSWRGANGLISNAPNYMFMDWVQIAGFNAHHPPAVIGQGYLTAFYYQALADGSRVANVCHDQERVARFDHLRTDVAAAFNAQLWNATAGLYRDGKPFESKVKPNHWLPADTDIETFSPQVNSLAVLYGLAPDDRQTPIMRKLMTAPQINCQPYFMYFLFGALERAGLFNEFAADQMHRWHINDDTQTYLEMWDGGDYSHAWGGAPLIYMSSTILGVKPASPGFDIINIQPHRSGLNWAKGQVPTPHGPVDVAWEAEGNKLNLVVTIPAGTSGIIETSPGQTVQVGSGTHQFSLLQSQ